MRPLRADHVLVKSANCAFSVEWIVERYKPSVLLQYRDPLNVVSSWLVHHIAPDVPVDHPAVRERIWGPQGVDTLPAPTSHVGRVALAVGCLTLALKVTADRHPDWTVISYDQLCEQPEAGFKRLFNHLALQWTDDVATYLDTADAPGFVDPHRNPRQLDDVSPEAWAREGRRAGQGTAFQRRMKPADVAEARAVLSELPLGEWAAAEEHEPDPR